MIKFNIQLFGGRGASSGTGGSGGGSGSGTGSSDSTSGSDSSGGSGGGFKNEQDFEKSLTGANDSRLTEYSNGYDSEESYTSGLKKNMNQAINEDGYTDTVDSVLKYEEQDAKDYIKSLPEYKTPEQLGRKKAMEDRLEVIQELKSKKGTKGSGVGDVDIFA